MTDEELRKLAEAATPGPWTPFIGNGRNGPVLAVCFKEPIGKRPVVIDWHGFDGNDLSPEQNRANAIYIAAMSPPVATGLLDRLAAAEERVKRLEEALRPFDCEDDATKGLADYVWLDEDRKLTLGHLRAARTALGDSK